MEAEKAIDVKLVDLERRSLLPQEIRELKTQRNTHAPISQLPDEILLEIFMVMMTRFPVGMWHKVAHVCRRWRNVAVEAPMLWTNPPTWMYQHNFTMLMLERSKGAGLTICLNSITSAQTARAVLSCIGRIESLEIELAGDEENEDDEDEIPRECFSQRILLPALAQEASRLKSLKITCNGGERWNSRAMLRLLHPLDQLSELSLMNVAFNWNVLPLNNLIHLYFQDVSLLAPISMQQFMNTLRQMSRLESLALPFSDNILLPYTLPATTEARLTLPFLRHLDLTDSHPDHLVYFFAHTTLPRLHRLEIGIKDSRGYSNFINNYHTTITRGIASLITNGDFCAFESLTFTSCSLNLSMFGKKDDSPGVELHVPSAWNRDEESIAAQIMLDLSDLCRPNFSKLLHLNMSRALDEAEYMRLFGISCRSYLQKITISNSNIMPTQTSVLTIPLQDDPSELVDIPFPNMKSISCNLVHFTESSVLDSFTDCLKLRRDYGYPLHELVLIDRSSMTSTQLTRLKDAVVSLNCTPA